MVFENVTLFEVHLDDAQFSADAGGADDGAESDAHERRAAPVDDRRVEERGADDAAAVDESESPERSSGRGRFVKLAAASVVVSVVATVVARRIAGRGEDPIEVNQDADRVRETAATVDAESADGPAVPSPDREE